MRRKGYLSVIGILLALVLGSAATLALMVKHVPNFYQRVALPEGPERQCSCREFFSRSTELFNMLGSERPSEQFFTEDQFNSYIQEQQSASDTTPRLIEIPQEIRDIRLALDDDLIRFGFRFGEGWWSCIVSVEFRIWLVARKTNVIALELCSFRAGGLPLTTQTLLDTITETAREQNIDVTWFRNQGHPVALLQLQANQPRPTFQLRKLEVQSGKLVIASSPTHDPANPSANAAKAEKPPVPAAPPQS